MQCKVIQSTYKFGGLSLSVYVLPT